MKTILLILSSSFLVSACYDRSSSAEKSGVDQCIRSELFDRCMKAIPSGPSTLVDTNNSWDDVVDSCNRASYQAARRYKSVTKPECWINE